MPKKMNAWKILKEEEYILAWDDFDLKFDFHPSTLQKRLAWNKRNKSFINFSNISYFWQRERTLQIIKR